MNQKELEQQLHDEFEATIPKVKAKGLRPTKFISMLNEYGGYETAKKLIGTREASQGFADLLMKGLSHLSVESIVLQDKYKPLFTEEELKICRERLE